MVAAGMGVTLLPRSAQAVKARSGTGLVTTSFSGDVPSTDPVLGTCGPGFRDLTYLEGGWRDVAYPERCGVGGIGSVERTWLACFGSQKVVDNHTE